MRDTMATSLTETATTIKAAALAVPPPPPPPPGMSSPTNSPTKLHPQQQQQQHQQQRMTTAFRINALKAPPGLGGGGGGGGIGSSGLGYMHRRAASTDDGNLSGSQRSQNSSSNGGNNRIGGGNQYYSLHNHHNINNNNHHNSSTAAATTSSPWNNFHNIFQTNDDIEIKQSRNETSSSPQHRLRSRDLDPMLLTLRNVDNDDEEEDDDNDMPQRDYGLDVFRRTAAPSSTTAAAGAANGVAAASSSPHRTCHSFANGSNNNNRTMKALYSPIIGTPTRGGGGASPNWAMNRRTINDTNGHNINPADVVADSLIWIPSIRPSLSCPTSVFESPLFPSSSSNSGRNNHGSSNTSLHTLGGGGGGGNNQQHGLNTITNNHHVNYALNNGLGGVAALLSQPYRLEKITSASAEPSPSHTSEENGLEDDHHGFFLRNDDDDDDHHHRLLGCNDEHGLDNAADVSDDHNGLLLGDGIPLDGDGLEHVDVSVIECDGEGDSPFRTKGRGRTMSVENNHHNNSHHHHHHSNHNNNSGGRMPSPMASPIKNVNVMESSASITAVAAVANPMRNLSDAFEMLVVDGGHASPSPSSGEKLPMMTTVADLESRLENNSNSINGSGNVPQQSRSDNNEELDYPTESMSKSGEESNASSATKPSPTSVLGLDSGDSTTTTSATAAAAAITTLQLENGLTVASVSHPHFHLHDSLRGSLCQGLVDRVSFYSVVRDINKEALDAAGVDPRGGVYNDGSGVHGKSGNGKQGCGGVVVGKVHSVGNIAMNGVVAEDGKVHVHPNTKDERNCVLVKACVLPNGGGKDANNPNEGPSSSDLNYAAAAANVGGGNGTNNIKSSTAATTTTTSTRTASPPTLGAALLDEEWWLMSAIASRTPEEVSINQSSELLPTFYEAMGEKDCAPSSTTVSTTAGGGGGGVGSAASDGNNAGAEKSSSSRTQLWKPGRSWWEAKSGKNPWVEPVVHNNRWRYLWPLIHYHKFIAKCIKKLKRNGIDVKCYPSNVCLFLRQEVCNVSDHLAFMSKYDSEEWTSALSHFDGWTDHDPNVEETLRTLVASQRLMGVAETADAQSSLIRGQIDDKILKAMQTAKDEAGRDAYDYKDEHFAKKDEVASSAGGGSSQQHSYSAQDNSFGRLPNRTTAWADESHLRSAIENKKRTINDTSWSNRSEFHPHHPPPYPHQDMYGQQFEHHPPYDTSGYEYGSGYGDAMSSQYYPPPPHHHHPHQQYDGYHGQYPPHPPHPPHMGYPPHHGDMPYNDPYGHPNQPYYNGGYYHHPTPDGSFHEGMVFDNSMHAQDPNYMPPSMALTPNRYQGSNLHPHGAQYPASPYWGHLNISQLPGIAPSPSIHITPSKPPRGSHPNRSFRKQRQQQYGHQQHGKGIDGKAKSLIMFPNQTNNAVGQSPASRFVMSPQDKSNPYYTSKNSQATTAVANNDVNAASSSLNQSTGQEESFVLPTIEDYSPESPSVADKTTAAGHTSLHSNTSMDLMPPSVKKMYRRDKKLSEVSENP